MPIGGIVRSICFGCPLPERASHITERIPAHGSLLPGRSARGSGRGLAITGDIDALVWGALMPGITTYPLEPWVSRALARGVSSVCLFEGASGSPERTRTTVRDLRAISPQLLISVDEEGGEVTRLQSATGSSFLSPAALGVIADTEVTRASARLLGEMLHAADVDWTFAPMADVYGGPANPAIGVRSFSGDAHTAAIQAEAFITGVQSTGVIATAKHFPGHGATHVDSHESLPTVSANIDLLHQRELLPFRSAIRVNVGAIMTGHLLVTALDADVPASFSTAITTDLLRGELGFSGVVVTDAIDMGAMTGADGEPSPHAVVSCLLAGADVVCLGSADQERATESAANAIYRALADGTLDSSVLAAAADRRAELISRRRDSFQHFDARADMQRVADAAERSLIVQGDVALAGSGIDVLSLSTSPGYDSGSPSWSLGSHLSRFGLDVQPVDVAPSKTDRDLVIEIRDDWKSGELLRSLAEAIRERPDAVIVDVGQWDPELPHCRGVITTHGIGNLSIALAACRLTGRDTRPTVLSILNNARA